MWQGDPSIKHIPTVNVNLFSVNIFSDWILVIITFEYKFGEDHRIQNFWAGFDLSQTFRSQLHLQWDYVTWKKCYGVL